MHDWHDCLKQEHNEGVYGKGNFICREITNCFSVKMTVGGSLK